MNYLKSFFANYLTVFFSDYLLPGIEVMDQTKLPHLKGDLIWPFALGLLNSLIYFILKMLQTEISLHKIILIAFILNFMSYAIVKILPLGLDVISIEGYILAASLVTICAILTNFFEMKRSKPIKMDTNELP